jgi:CDGSH-type Zn-finger protein
VEGPVEVELEDGTVVSSDRFRVAVCTCRRSRRYPWCDTSHRDRVRMDPGGSDSPPERNDRRAEGSDSHPEGSDSPESIISGEVHQVE